MYRQCCTRIWRVHKCTRNTRHARHKNARYVHTFCHLTRVALYTCTKLICPLRAHVLPSNTHGTLDVHQTNMLVTCARFIITHAHTVYWHRKCSWFTSQYYKSYSTMAPDSIIRQLTSQLIEPTDHVPLPYIKTTLTGNSFLKMVRMSLEMRKRVLTLWTRRCTRAVQATHTNKMNVSCVHACSSSYTPNKMNVSCMHACSSSYKLQQNEHLVHARMQFPMVICHRSVVCTRKMLREFLKTCQAVQLLHACVVKFKVSGTV